MTSGKDVKGAGATFISPGWLTALQRNWGDASAAVRQRRRVYARAPAVDAPRWLAQGVPRADAKPEDVADLLGATHAVIATHACILLTGAHTLFAEACR